MKIVSVLAALACCGTTMSLAFGPLLSSLAALIAAPFAALAGLPALVGIGLPETLALLGALVVFWSGTHHSEDV